MPEILDMWDFFRRGETLLGVAEAKTEHAFSSLMLRLERDQPGFPKWQKLLARPTEQDPGCPWVVSFGEPGDFFWTLNRGLWREFPEEPPAPEPSASEEPTEVRTFEFGVGERLPIPSSKGAQQAGLFGEAPRPAEEVFTRHGRPRKRKEQPHA